MKKFNVLNNDLIAFLLMAALTLGNLCLTLRAQKAEKNEPAGNLSASAKAARLILTLLTNVRRADVLTK